VLRQPLPFPNLVQYGLLTESHGFPFFLVIDNPNTS
jgi:hypothetical protein